MTGRDRDERDIARREAAADARFESNADAFAHWPGWTPRHSGPVGTDYRSDEVVPPPPDEPMPSLEECRRRQAERICNGCGEPEDSFAHTLGCNLS